VLGGIAFAAPPQNSALLNDVVEPALADLLGARTWFNAIVFERADEGEGAGHVAAGDDERLVWPLVDVVLDRSVP